MATGICGGCGQRKTLYGRACAKCLGDVGGSHRRYGNAEGGTMGANEFVEALKSQLRIGDRQARIRVDRSLGAKKDDVYVNYINLPTGIGGAGGGAEAENNRASFWVWGFGADGAPPASGKVKLEMSNSVFSPQYKLRGRTAAPTVIAKYLADFLNKIAAEVPPHFTHTRA